MKYGLAILLLIASACWSQTSGGGDDAKSARNAAAPRRLSGSLKSELATCLKKEPGRFSVASIADNSEAYAYARDWRDVLVAAGWEDGQADGSIQSFRIGGGMWSGMRVSVHGASPDRGQSAFADGSAEQNFERCVAGKHDIPAGGRIIPYEAKPSGSIDVQVSNQP